MSRPVPAPSASRPLRLPPLGEADGHALRLDPRTERELWGLVGVLMVARLALWLI
jgi:hypothetical protein